MKKKSSVLHTTLILLALGVIGYLLKLAFNIYLARSLPAALYGDFAVAIKVLNIVATLILLGTNVSANRFLSSYLTSHDHRSMRDYFAWNIRIILATSFFCFFVIILGLGALHFLSLNNFSLLTELHLAIHLLWISPLVAAALLFSSFLRCNQNYYLSYFFSNIAKYIFMFSFFVIGIYFFDIAFNTYYLVLMVLIAFIILLIIEAITFHLYMPKELLLSLKSAWQKPKMITSEWMNTSIRLIGNNMIFLVLSATDLLIVEIIAPHEASVGYYAAALAIANIIWVIPNSTFNIIKPLISSAVAEKNFTLLQKKLDYTNIIIIPTTIMITFLVNVFAFPIFQLFRYHTVPAMQTTLLILSIGYFIGALCKPSTLLLAYSGQEKILLKITCIEFISILILGFPLTYFYGIKGAAAAAAIAIIIKSVLMYLAARRRYPLRSCLIG